MTMRRDDRTTRRGDHTTKRRIDGSLLVSLAVHVVLGALLYFLISIPLPDLAFWHTPVRHEPPQERVQYVRVPAGGGGAPAARAPRTVPTRPRAVPLVAPTEVPSEIPPPPAADTAGAVDGGSDAGGGATRGVVPSYGDRRLWLSPSDVPREARTLQEELDSIIVTSVQEHLDSIAAVTPSHRPGDWTVSRGGKKYGMDQHNIYIGDVKIPSTLLALLPLNSKHLQGNPVAMSNARRIQAMHNEIEEQAQRGITEAEFRAAVKRIAERKERERREREQKEQREKKNDNDKSGNPPIAAPQQR
ncbi:MAG TPA: hypothetical protein VFK13_15970 [Gemmatimonadaceae bacterium]|nr:hypothetical protein [Gemmatimonadaceae bacterium]